MLCIVFLLSTQIVFAATSEFMESNKGFVEEKGQYKAFDDLQFYLQHDNMFIYFLSDRVVFVSQEVDNIPNEKSLLEQERGNQNLALKYSAVTTAHRFDLVFLNANLDAEVSGEEKLSHTSDYYLGHCPEGILNVNSFNKIRYENIYQGVDLIFYLNEGTLKYEFELSSEVSPSVISLKWEGIQNSSIDESGAHNFTVGNFNIKDNAPVSFSDNKRVNTQYIIDNDIIGFNVDEYDDTQTLIIDPGLIWTSSLEYNGYGSWGALVTNSIGEFYVVDWEWSPSLADLTNYLSSAGTSIQYGSDNTNNEVIISKFSTNGDLLWVCQYGGSGDDDVNGGVEIDGNDNLYIAGTSQKLFSAGSGDFPLQVLGGAFNQAWDGSLSTGTRGYLLKFLPDNTRQWSTYLDRGANLEVFDIEYGIGNTIYMCGKSGGYPTYIQAGSIPSGSGYQGALNGTGTSHSFVLEFSNSGSLSWATWLPGITLSTYTGRSSDIAVNKSSGSFYIVGDEMWDSSTPFSTSLITASYTNQGDNDMFYMSFNSSNQPVPAYGDYIGGAGWDKINIGAANGDIELDKDGDLYVCGHTYSANFPLVDPGGCAYFDGVINDGTGITANEASTQDGYLFKVNPSGTITYSTFFGGTSYSSMKQLQKDSKDNLWICGHQHQAGAIAAISHTDYYNQTFVGTNVNLMLAQLRDDEYMEWLSYYGFTAGFSGYLGYDIFETGVDTVELYLAGKFTGLTPFGGGYQFTNAASCTGAAKFKNVLSAIEPDTITPNTAVDCSISELSVTGSLPVGAIWVWYTGGCGVTQIGTGVTISINPVVTTTYYVQAEGACITSTCDQITVDPTIPASVSVDFSTICDGESATLTAESGFVDYDWSTGSTSDAITVSPSITTIYTVTVLDSNGCTAVVSTTITVNPLPAANATNGGPYCSGNDLELFATTVTGATYTWDGPNLFSSGNQNPVITSCSITDAGIYNLTVTANGCTNTSLTTVTVNAGPSSVASNGGPYCEGDNIDLSCTAVGGATYSWDGPNLFTSGVQNPVVGGCSSLDAGTYNLTVTLGGCSTSSSTLVVVNLAPASLATSGAPYCVGEDINLSTTLVAGATYSWSGPSLFSSSSQNPTIVGCDLTNVGTYTVTVTLGGCTNTSSTLVNINPKPGVSLGINLEPLCNGDSDGVLDITITSGTPDYTVDWGTGSYITSTLVNQITGISSGLVTVNVSDNFGCTTSQNITMTEPGILSASITSFQDQNCATHGSATIDGASGTVPYTYSWPATAGGVSGNSATDLIVGNYDVTVYDANLCQYIQSVNVVDIGSLAVSSSITSPISCYGGTDGEITVDITSGTPNFDFDSGLGSMTSGTFTNVFNNLSANSYSLTITDAMGCSSVQDIVLTEPNQITSSITLQSDQICSTPGSATVQANNGIIPYQYFWPATAGGVSGNTASALVVGSYDVTIEDVNTCSVVQTVVINDVGAITCSVTGYSDPQCYNATDGSITLDIATGTPDFSLDFGSVPIITSSSPYIVSGLSSGDYDITITDANGCSSIVSQTLTNPTELQFTSNIYNHVTCNGLSDGSAEIVPFGGTPTYGITWSDPILTGMTQNALSFGNYDFTVTDANTCQVVGSLSINEPAALSATENTIDPLCVGDNASTTITPVGGTSPYSIAWEDGSTSFIHNSIPVNSVYGFTVTDAGACIYSNSVFASNASPFTVSLISTDVSCFGLDDGIAAVDVVTGGVFPISYEWSNGQVNSQISNLSAGIYDLTITDDNLCEAIASIEIFEPGEILVDISTTNADCSGNTGSASVIASGGAGGLTYSWSCVSATTPDVTGIVPGFHFLTVTDLNSCESVESFDITTSGSISIVINIVQPILCYGESNGILDAASSSANTPFQYQWSTGSNSSSISGLGSGDYNLTLTDSWGCAGTSAINISEPGQITLNANISNIGCYGDSNGAIHLNVSGGTSPYSYLWQDGSDLPYIENLTAGDYSITITDFNSCVISETIEVTQSDFSLDVNAQVVSIVCYGDQNGEIHLSSIGGIPPIVYNVSGLTYNSTGADHTGLKPGTYNIDATDSNGCSDYAEVTLSEPAQLAANAIVNHPSCYGNNDGSIFIVATGGTSPYSYYVDGFPMIVDTLNAFGAGIYEISIIDGNGCEVNLGFVNLIDDPLVDCIVIPNAFTPNGDGINDTWIIHNLDIYDDAHIQLFNRWGQEIRESREIDFEWDGLFNGRKLPAGPYLYVVNIFERKPYVGIVTIVY